MEVRLIMRHSNTTLVKVKLKLIMTAEQMKEFKYNTC